MYDISQIRTAISHPKLIIREANRLYHTKFGQHEYNPGGIDIFSKDWDNLIILDACRYDMYEEVLSDTTKLQKVQSRGSGTVEFVSSNILGRELHDTVYVTANPQYHKHTTDSCQEFHHVCEIWKGAGWNNEIGTVLPETMVRETKKAANKFENKRIISHFLQPHYPFLSGNTDFDKGNMKSDNELGDFWRQIYLGELDVSPEIIWKEYKSNLNRVMESVEELKKELTGKTIITSDHGNMVGEPATPLPVKEWGHPLQIYTDELVSVPWHEVSSGPRKEIIPEPPEKFDGTDNKEVVADRLADLGYI